MDLFLTDMQLSLHKTLNDGLEWCGLLVDYCDVFIRCWTLILTAPIHCRGSIDDAKCLQINSKDYSKKKNKKQKKKSILIPIKTFLGFISRCTTPAR